MIIGLTGGIGSGKSTVSKYLKENGYTVIDADKISRDLTREGEELYFQLIETFGDVAKDRKALGRLVFNDKEKKELLEEIVTKKVISEIEKMIIKAKDDIVLDAPLLFETGMNKRCDKVILVTSSIENRIKRVVERDHLSEEEVLSRINNQMKDEDKKADVVIENDGTLEELYSKIKDI